MGWDVNGMRCPPKRNFFYLFGTCHIKILWEAITSELWGGGGGVYVGRAGVLVL